jgi:sugar phosphate isomerase/epimerase
MSQPTPPNAEVPIETILGGKPTEWKDRQPRLVERLQAWARVAEAEKVRIAVKPHVSNALHKPEDALGLLKQVNSPSIKLAYDFSHFQLQGLKLETTLSALIAETIFIHVKDAKGTQQKYDFLLPGDGDIDYPAYAKLLTASRYRGPVVVEVSGLIFNKPGYDPIAAATKCYKNLQHAFG